MGPGLTRYRLCEPEKSLPLGAFLEPGEIRMPTDLMRQWRGFTEEVAANSPHIQAQEEGGREPLAPGLGALQPWEAAEGVQSAGVLAYSPNGPEICVLERLSAPQ